MSPSPAQRHRARMDARYRIERGPNPDLTPSPDSLHVQILALKQDVERLRALPTIADRVTMKRTELLPKWRPYVERYLSAGKVYDNPVFSYVTIWLFDVGELTDALVWADIAIEQNQQTPSNIKRRFPEFVADVVLEWAQEQAVNGHSIEPYFGETFTKVREKWRLHEEITSKWFKFAGQYLLRDQDGQPRASAVDNIDTLKQADVLLAEAEKFHKAAQVKTLRSKIAQRIRALEEM